MLLRGIAEPDEAARKARTPPKILIDCFPKEIYRIHHYYR
jgi:hypothetical protein